MTDEQAIALIIFGIPSVVVIICWISVMITMRNTTGELKLFLSPENLVKLFAIYLVLTSAVFLSVTKIIDGQTSGVILSGIIGYVVGAKFNKD